MWNVWKLLKIFRGTWKFFGIFENFFITDSGSTGLDLRSSVGIFFLLSSVPEMTCLEGCISRTVGPRGSVSETTWLHFGIRVERRWNHSPISFRWDCVLLESRGCSLPVGEILEIRGRVYRAMLFRFEIRFERRWNDPSSSIRSGCVLMEGVVFDEIFLSFEGKIGKMVKNSTTPIDREYRETYFVPINLGQNILTYFQIF